MVYIAKEYRFSLKRYHRAADKPDCPSCGGKHRFSEYIDNRTGLPVGDGVGKCDRINHCCYHLTPKEYFQKNPEARYRMTNQSVIPVKQIEKRRLFLPGNAMELYNTSFMQSNFGKWLASIAPSDEALQNTAKMYHLSATLTGGIIFWYIDHYSRLCQGKMMWYRMDGHRNGYVSTISSDLAKKHIMPESAEMERCLFGAHLLKERADAVVCLVEAEKTAVVMSMFKPECIWLASGGCSMLTSYTLSLLAGRSLVVIPDSGVYNKWKSVLEKSGLRDYKVIDLLEQYEDNTDIVDVLLGEGTPR